VRAVVQERYGSPDVLRLAEVDPPVPKDDEVLVRVRAAGVDRGVWHLVGGTPYATRLAFGLRRPRQPTPGMDLAGTVEQVGDDVTGFAPGDEVLGVGRGTFAELAVAKARKLVHRPPTLAPVPAAATAISGLTALQAVRDHGHVEAGQRVLVLGASGGVGSFLVQLAAARGAEVTGVCRGSKADVVRHLGAAHVIDHTSADPLDGSVRYDVTIDVAGNATLRRHRRALTPRGRLVIVGGEHGGPLLGGVERNLRAVLWSPFVGQSMTAFVSREGAEDLQELVDLIVAGHVTPAVDRTYPLSAAPDALRDLEAGRVCGKLVVTV
jgi:NADPH:quinone reductase-like Zn-dependent oxidoreductase